MAVRIGFDQYSVAHRDLSAEATLQFAVERGFDGVQFLDPASIEPALDLGRLRDFHHRAEALGLYVEAGLPSPNPIRHSRRLEREIPPREHAHQLARHVDALAALGCRRARVYVGDRHDRFRTDVRWDVQRVVTLEVLHALTPRLRDHGIRLALETHADLTVDELLALLDRLDPAVAGVTLDTGNLLMRLDEPLAAAERLAPWVVATHIKDAVLAFTARGLCWQARPVGSGILPMPDLLAPLLRANPDLTLSIELHPRTYDLPIFDKTWLAFFPALRPECLAAMVALALRCEHRFAEGSLLRPELVESIPWADRDLDWLASSLGYLRRVVQGLTRFYK